MSSKENIRSVPLGDVTPPREVIARTGSGLSRFILTGFDSSKIIEGQGSFVLGTDLNTNKTLFLRPDILVEPGRFVYR